MMAIIPDVPEECDIQLRRAKFLTEKLIDLVVDDVEIDPTFSTSTNHDDSNV